MRLVTLACATIAAAVLAGTAPAAPGLRVGIPGRRVAAVRSRDARGACRATRRARRRPRARDARMADDRGHPRDVRLGARGCAAAGVAPGGPDAAGQHLGHAGVGERRPRWERATELGGRVRVIRPGSGGAVPVGASMDRVERAEPAPVALAAVADPLRHATPQPRGDRDQGRHPAGVDRRRRDRAARGPGGTSPVDFIRGMGRAGARLDAYAHHPHPLSPAETPTSGGCARCTTISLATLDRLIQETRNAFGSRVRIWLTELGFQTNPPDRILGVGWGTQARYVAEAQHLAYRAAGVDVVIQYLLRDEPATDAWQSGLETVSGRAKPALAAFSLPLVQVARRGLPTTVWGQVRPERAPGRTCSSGSSATSGKRSAPARRRRRRGIRHANRCAPTRGTRLRLYDPATQRPAADHHGSDLAAESLVPGPTRAARRSRNARGPPALVARPPLRDPAGGLRAVGRSSTSRFAWRAALARRCAAR